MNVKSKIVVSVILFLAVIIAQAPIAAVATQPFSATYGGAADEAFNGIIRTADNGYAMVGYTNSYGNGTSRIWLVKTDADGREQWNRTYGGNVDDVGYAVAQAPDGGYAIAGYTASYGNGSMNVCLIRTDDNGNMIWNRTYGGNVSDGAFSIARTSDGGYAICGFSYSYGHGGWDVYLIRTDAEGSLLWNKTYGGPDKDAGHFVEQTSDGGFIITGYTKSYGNGGGDQYGVGAEDLWVVKTDSQGNELWNRTFGGKDYDDGFSVHQCPDGGYVVAGTTKSYDARGNLTPAYSKNDTARAYLIRLDPDGNVTWDRTFGGSTDVAVFSMAATNDSYVMTGTTFAAGGDADIVAIKTDLAGNEQWAYSYGGVQDEYGFSTAAAGDGYGIAGFTRSYGNGGSDGYLLVIGADGSAPVTAGGNSGIPLAAMAIVALLCITAIAVIIWKWILKK